MQMKKLGYALFVGLAACVCILPTLVMPWQETTAVGNEHLASLPQLWNEEDGLNTSILSDFSDYFADNFGFRHELITINDQLTGAVFGTLSSDSVLLGKNDWLFYRSTLEDYTGSALFSKRESYAAAHTLLLMQEYCQDNGIDFCFTIAPNKNTLYGSYMPDSYTASTVHNAQLLADQLEQQGVNYADLFAVLDTKPKESERLYYRLDSHWNMRGAQLAAQALLEQLNSTAVDFDALLTDENQPHTGDLYEMVYPAGTRIEQDAVYDFDYEYDEHFRSADDITIHTTSDTADGSIYVYRDSFGENLHPFLAQCYGQACFSRNMPYRLTAVTAEQPDTLLVEIVERNLVWLLERAPEMPAPERAAVSATESILPVTAERSGSSMDGYFCVTGDLGRIAIDEDSPIYIVSDTAAYEACPSGSGRSPFTAYLPTAEQEQPLSVAFKLDGQWQSCTLKD